MTPSFRFLLRSGAAAILAAGLSSGQPLDRSGFVLTFSDEFSGPLSLADGTGESWKGEDGRNWYAYPPFQATVGDAPFLPANASTENGNLVLKATKVSGEWRAALVSSQFPTGKGFAQKFGYFEARMKFPGGVGTWPQFWLFGQGLNQETGDRFVTAEIDILEQYGKFPDVVHQNYHQWTPDSGSKDTGHHETFVNLKKPDSTPALHKDELEHTAVIARPADFHIYGVLVSDAHIVWYIDDREVYRIPTPDEAKKPLFVILDYALGGGYPIDEVKDGSSALVDYVRVYSEKR